MIDEKIDDCLTAIEELADFVHPDYVEKLEANVACLRDLLEAECRDAALWRAYTLDRERRKREIASP